MTETEHYKLQKPGENDYADIGVLNGNADILDEAIHALSQGSVAGAAEKAGLVDADHVVITDSADSGKPKRVLWSVLKSLFAAAGHKHAAGDITSGTLGVARGGTGAANAAGARANLGIYSKDETVELVRAGNGRQFHSTYDLMMHGRFW